MGILKKYEFTGKTKVITQFNKSHTLHQIKALKDFRDIKAGYLGGWIEKEENLSQGGDCWVYSNAMVYGDAQVYGGALIYDYAQVYGNAEVYDNAEVYGNACVSDYAQVKATAKVYDEANLFEHANILNVSQICGTSVIRGRIRVRQKNLVLKDVYLESDDYELTVF